jgi:hypothetical protein
MPRYIPELPLETHPLNEAADPYGWIVVPSNQIDQQREDAEKYGCQAIGYEPYIGNMPVEGTVSIVGPNRFELTTTEKMHETIAPHFHDVREAFVAETQRILADPFGKTNIDTNKDTDAGQWFRLVHAVEGPLADAMPDRPLALKSTGLDMDKQRYFGGAQRANLADQFRVMHSVGERQRSSAPEGIGQLVTVNEVHGVLRYTNPDTGKLQEWMLMDHVTNAKPVEELRLALTNGTTVPGFDRDEYPQLASYVEGQSGFGNRLGYPIRFAELGEKLSHEIGHFTDHFTDLRGDNLLEQRTTDGQLHYTVIDINGQPSR